MPAILQKKYSENLLLLIWELDEELDFYLEKCLLTSEEHIALQSIDPIHKKKEFVATRFLCQKICSDLHIQYSPITKYDTGKPYLSLKNAYLSLSHSKNILALAISKSKEIGLDIEYNNPKVLNIANRVFSESEVAAIDGDIVKATQYWTIKEALYKAKGLKGIFFKEQIHIIENSSFLIGQISLEQRKLEFDVYLETLDTLQISLVIARE
ncbi:MAG: 4'-phosphopantetheinyl transferase family protein [Leadbetterella sp.]